MKKIDLSIICCVWNEINRAPIQLKHMLEILANSTLNFEIIIIDNCSTDGSREWIDSLEFPAIVKILNNKNLGKGGSIKKGIESAKSDIAVIFDLDGEYLFEDVLTGVECHKKCDATVTLASRTLGGEGKYIYVQNYLGVKFITWIINILFRSNLTDTATGLKILNSKFFKEKTLYFNGFNVDFEIVCVALKHGGVVAEYCGQYFPRSKLEGKKIKAVQDGLKSLFAIVATYLRP